MTQEADLISERIEGLGEYIRLLARVKGVVWRYGLNRAEQAVLDELDRKVALKEKILAVIAGVAVFALGFIAARFLGVLPVIRATLILAGIFLWLPATVLVYLRARCKVANHEIQVAQLHIYRLQDELNK